MARSLQTALEQLSEQWRQAAEEEQQEQKAAEETAAQEARKAAAEAFTGSALQDLATKLEQGVDGAFAAATGGDGKAQEGVEAEPATEGKAGARDAYVVVKRPEWDAVQTMTARYRSTRWGMTRKTPTAHAMQ